jgi:hypothetical protein
MRKIHFYLVSLGLVSLALGTMSCAPRLNKSNTASSSVSESSAVKPSADSAGSSGFNENQPGVITARSKSFVLKGGIKPNGM